MKFIAIVEARTGSKRLPNKVMKKLNKKEAIIFLVDRLKRSKEIDKIVIATTDKKNDDKLVKLVSKNNLNFFRGSENNVLRRVYFAAKKFNADVIIEISGDSPFIDPIIIDEAILFFKKNLFIDYLNVQSGYPGGVGFQIFNFNSLENCYFNSKLGYEKEHVTPYIIKNPTKFNSFYFTAEKKNKLPDTNFLLDEQKDYFFLKAVLSKIKKKNFLTSDLVKLINKREIDIINKKVKRNSVHY